ncbi:MAG: efflux RND transporter permease subunit [Planctomycetia bacterium]|nr:efflux RND transporter permease subunit [Planctomycetia bacterium]
MLNRIIHFSLSNRAFILVFAVLLTIFGYARAVRLPIDVLPDLNRPRVTIMTECPGMAPEEVETLVTTPLETALIGVQDVESIRSASAVGLSTITLDFAWDAQPYRHRQAVSERLQSASRDLPGHVTPQMTPISSVMGQILTLAIYSEDGSTSPMTLRTIADWDVRRLLLSHQGVSEAFVMGGEKRQYQVLLRPEDLLHLDITVEEVEEALEQSNVNVTGGFLTKQGPKQYLVRSIGRIQSYDDLKTLVVKSSVDPPIQLCQVADVVEGASTAVGDASVALRQADGTRFESPAVAVTVEKQPHQDARKLTQSILCDLASLQERLQQDYPDLRIEPIYEQSSFVELAVSNVLTSLRDGAILVAIIVFLFLTSYRTTFITLITIPTTFAATCLVFALFHFSINAMTLGGLAVAIGEVVDDAIVDVENIRRRLKENASQGRRLSSLNVVYAASSEIRRSVVNGTAITALVFLPIFFLEGMEGKLFAPLGLAYVVALLSSLAVSLTVTPALSYWIFSGERLVSRAKGARGDDGGVVLRVAKSLATGAIRLGLSYPVAVLTSAILLGVTGALAFARLDRDFIPGFNEGAIQVNLDLAPGVSLSTSSEIATRVAQRLIEVDGISSVIRKTGRSEMDEHAVPVNTSEFICSIDPKSKRSFEEISAEVRATIDGHNIPGALASFDQPLQHLINHLRSGSSSKIAIKLTGSNLLQLRRATSSVKEALADIEDIGSLRAEPMQTDLPQLQIRLNRDSLARYGLTPDDVERTILIALNGSTATTALEGERTIEVVTRLGADYRENIDLLRRLPIRLPSVENKATLGLTSDFGSAGSSSSLRENEREWGEASRVGVIPLMEVAELDIQAHGPGQIDHENGRRQVVLQSTPRRRGAVSVKNEIEERLSPLLGELRSHGVEVRITGLFESESAATRTLLALSFFSFLAIVLILYKMFHSLNLAFQVLAIVPLALVGAVFSLYVTGQSRTIPSLIGMISLCGVASRNGVLLLERYLHLVEYEGEGLTKSMIIRAGRERVAPVLMTALTSAIGLAPLAVSANAPGREILYPIATVMIGGLIASTCLEFFVRPALFWSFGLNAARRYVERNELDTSSQLDQEPPIFRSTPEPESKES